MLYVKLVLKVREINQKYLYILELFFYCISHRCIIVVMKVFVLYINLSYDSMIFHVFAVVDNLCSCSLPYAIVEFRV